MCADLCHHSLYKVDWQGRLKASRTKQLSYKLTKISLRREALAMALLRAVCMQPQGPSRVPTQSRQRRGVWLGDGNWKPSRARRTSCRCWRSGSKLLAIMAISCTCKILLYALHTHTATFSAKMLQKQCESCLASS